jgi:hypothetical protein
MFRPAWNNPNGFDASGSGDLTLPPPTMLTEAFIAAHTEVLCQLLQTQQQMAQQLQQMPPMQSKVQPSKPCSLEVPTQRDINTIVGATQLLEGKNSMLNQMVYDIIQGRYGKPYQNSLADSLSQSLSASMVEQVVCSICWKSMLIKTNPKPPTQYYHLLDYQWILEQKRRQTEATNESYPT